MPASRSEPGRGRGCQVRCGRMPSGCYPAHPGLILLFGLAAALEHNAAATAATWRCRWCNGVGMPMAIGGSSKARSSALSESSVDATPQGGVPKIVALVRPVSPTSNVRRRIGSVPSSGVKVALTLWVDRGSGTECCGVSASPSMCGAISSASARLRSTRISLRLPGVIRRTQGTGWSVNGYRYSAPFEAQTVAVITQTT